MLALENKVALITGASKGIGAAAARELAGAGASVLLAARSTDRIVGVAEEITQSGGTADYITCDVARYDQLQDAVARCVQRYDALDILVNNAGVIDPIAHLAESDPIAWAHAVDVNVKGVYYGVRAALPVMLKQGSGVVVNISSGAAVSAIEGWSHYCASKAAAKMITECTHKEYAEQGIRVVGLSPGTVATDMQVAIRDSGINPVSQLDWSDHIPAEWVGKAIVFLCGDQGRRYDGTDFSLKTDEGRRLVGLIEQ